LKYSIRVLILALVLLAAGSSLWGHHSPTAEFDMSKKLSLTGTLTKVDWINPHIQVALDAKNTEGKIENWTFESNPPSWFRRVGVNRAEFAKAIGQTVSVEAVRAKNGTLYGYLQKISFPDGTSLELVTGQ
jgi:hypothetical protein